MNNERGESTRNRMLSSLYCPKPLEQNRNVKAIYVKYIYQYLETCNPFHFRAQSVETMVDMKFICYHQHKCHSWLEQPFVSSIGNLV